MLPGFRFLFAAIVLSVSVLIFGVGAAALLRAAHREFSSIPSRHAPPETVFVRNEAAPALAMLRVEAAAAPEQSVADAPAGDDLQASSAQQASLVPVDLEPQGAAPELEQVPAPHDLAAPAESEPSSPEATQPTDRPAQIEPSSPPAETEIATIEDVPPTASAHDTLAATASASDSTATAETRLVAPAVPMHIGSLAKSEQRKVRKKRAAVPAIEKPVLKKQVAVRRKVQLRPRIARPELRQPAPFTAPFGGWDNPWPGKAGKT